MAKSRRVGRCLCGIRVALHFDYNNNKLTCEQARLAHRYAAIKFKPLRVLMINSVMTE